MVYAQAKYQPSAGYSPPGSKASFGAAFLIHAAVIGTLILIPSTVVYELPEEDGMDTIRIKVDPPNPVLDETVPDRPDKPAFQPKTRIDAPPTPLPRPYDDTSHVIGIGDGVDLTGIGTDDGIIDGKGTGFPIEDIAPKPDPVFVPPSISPRYAASMQPIYPGSLKRQEIEGTVRVRVLVGTDGRVKKLERLEATHDAFFRATERQSRKWRFNPATEGGEKIEAWYTVSLKFEMEP
ncbi:energy transducer TonB [Sphingorhabdus sp. Alg239-R122]|uniref:energy transducer TonB n=1 Tax=Sphingorhabdus sp. Alg239-R122 TaxID=2305989 RepID=UPI0013DD78B3|nr:energy transducer TonB [Sphingorhabdus sp. Alg239-R122]